MSAQHPPGPWHCDGHGINSASGERIAKAQQLYQTYRPQSPTDFVGDAARVAESLMLLEPPAPAVVLLSGPSGCGKTSLARMLATAWADDQWGVREVPCNGTKGTTREIADDVADWLELAPLRGRCKAVLLEECHGLTGKAQDSMLGVLEDVRPNRLIIATTTEPAALRPAFRSRFHCLPVSSPTRTEIMALVSRVAAAEGVALSATEARRLADQSADRVADKA